MSTPTNRLTGRARDSRRERCRSAKSLAMLKANSPSVEGSGTDTGALTPGSALNTPARRSAEITLPLYESVLHQGMVEITCW